MKVLLIDIPSKRIERVYADSAIGRHTMPLFLPGSAADLRARVFLALRVSRLGKSVIERFGSRYVDAYSAILAIEPTTIGPDSMTMDANGNVHAALSLVHSEAELSSMDFALTTGEWQPTEEAAPITVSDMIPLAMPNAEGRTLGEIPVCGLEEVSAKAVEIASRISTIKTGDLLLIQDRSMEVRLCNDTYIRCTNAFGTLLNVKVK